MKVFGEGLVKVRSEKVSGRFSEGLVKVSNV